MLHEVKGKLEHISNTEFQKMFNVILEDFNERAEAGYI